MKYKCKLLDKNPTFLKWQSSKPNYHFINRRNKFSCKMNSNKGPEEYEANTGEKL